MMRKTHAFFLCIITLLGGCDKYDDSSIKNDIHNLENRIASLEKWQNETNNNLVSLQNIVEALNGKDYVTNVSENKDDEGNTISYTIHFNKGGSKVINIENKDNTITIPTIGIKIDSDGIYYWTLNGDWIVDESGNKIKASASDGITPKLKIEDGFWFVSYDNGKTWKKLGATAADGTDGADGITPKLKIEDGFWFVSYDNGKTWKKLGATAADGTDGADGITPKLKIEDGFWFVSYDNGNTWKKLGVTAADGNDGADGVTPRLKIEDGFWFVSYDNGQTWEKLGAAAYKGADGVDGKTPKIKVENGFWFVSYDDGKTWENIGSATTPGSGSGDSSNPCIFRKVTVSDSYVTFVLTDGTSFALPIGEELSISFTKLDSGILSPNSSLKIRYEVKSSSKSIDIETIGSSDIITEIITDDSSNKTGIINVTAGEFLGNQTKVVILVGNGNKIIMKSIHFEKGTLEINDNSTRIVEYKGGIITLEFLTNLEYDAVISDNAKSWISKIETRTIAKHSLQFKISENTGEDRVGTICIQSRSSAQQLVYTITQKGICTLTLPDGNNVMPCGGTITAQYPPDNQSNGLDKMFDNNNSTSYRISGKSTFEFIWEGKEAKSIKKFYLNFGSDSATRPNGIELLASNDGKKWDYVIGIGGNHIYMLNQDFPKSSRYKFVKLIINNTENLETVTIAEFHLIAGSESYSTFEDIVASASSFTNTPSTPMGNHYINKHITTEDDKIWLSTASNEPDLLASAPKYTWREYAVDLYPFGEPMPADVNQHGIGDCSALAVFAEMAYLFPDFIKSIIKDNGDGTYTVNMFDPQGKEIVVSVQSTFLGSDIEIGAVTGKKKQPTWASILEKAIMKWNYIYKVNSDINGIGSEHVAPLFTGNGDSFAFSPNSMTSENLKQVVDICLDKRMIVIGGFNIGGLLIGSYQTVTAHAYSFMYSNNTSALFSMRNPWGYSPGSNGKEDGILDIIDDETVPPTIDLRIIYPGIAEKYAKKTLTPYSPPEW